MDQKLQDFLSPHLPTEREDRTPRVLPKLRRRCPVHRPTCDCSFLRGTFLFATKLGGPVPT